MTNGETYQLKPQDYLPISLFHSEDSFCLSEKELQIELPSFTEIFLLGRRLLYGESQLFQETSKEPFILTFCGRKILC